VCSGTGRGNGPGGFVGDEAVGISSDEDRGGREASNRAVAVARGPVLHRAVLHRNSAHVGLGGEATRPGQPR
jgi:hypothetical protein